MAEERHEAGSDAVAALRSQIEETRARIVATVDAIEERLRPRRLVAEAGETIKEAAARPLKTARLHPVLSLSIAAAAMAVTAGLVRRQRGRTDTFNWPPPGAGRADTSNP